MAEGRAGVAGQREDRRQGRVGVPRRDGLLADEVARGCARRFLGIAVGRGSFASRHLHRPGPGAGRRVHALRPHGQRPARASLSDRHLVRHLGVPARADLQPLPAALRLRVQHRDRPPLGLACAVLAGRASSGCAGSRCSSCSATRCTSRCSGSCSCRRRRPSEWRSFLAVDVLQLIGVTFIGVQIHGAGRRGRAACSRWAAFLLALAAVLVTPLFWGVDWTRRLPLWLAAYLTPSAGSQFPVFPWAAYVLVGAALGQWYLRWGPARLDWYANVALFAPGLALVTLAFVVGASARVAGRRRRVGRGARIRWRCAWAPRSSCCHSSRGPASASPRLPHVFGAVAQETLLIYFVHLCIVYGSIWNRGLAQIFGPTLGPGRTVVCVVLLLAAMAGLAWYWNWWKHTKPRAARWTARLAVCWTAFLLAQYRLLSKFPRPSSAKAPGAESPEALKPKRREACGVRKCDRSESGRSNV